MAPQWIFLPGLPLHLYRPDCLRILATRFGRYLGTDHATINRTRASGARFCVEIDLSAEVVDFFPITVGSTTLWQSVKYEKLGSYCKKCRRQGHIEAVCRVGQQIQEKQKEKKVETIIAEKREWRQKNGDKTTGGGIGKRNVQEDGVKAKVDASVLIGTVYEERGDNINNAGESSRGTNFVVENDNENRDVPEIELGIDKDMDEDIREDGEQAREEGEIEEGGANLNEEMMVTIQENELTNVMATHKMVRNKDDQVVKENEEKSQEDSRDHGITDEVMIISDIEVEGIVEELGNIRDCTSDSEQRAQGYTRKSALKVRSSSRVPSKPSRLNL